MESSEVYSICLSIVKALEDNSVQEHTCYKLGDAAFSSKRFLDDAESTGLATAKEWFGDSWNKQRYHHLVRIGGDILRSGLAEYSKATVLGSFLWFKKSQRE